MTRVKPVTWDWMWIDDSLAEGGVQYLTQLEFEEDMSISMGPATLLVKTAFLHIEQNSAGQIAVYIHKSLIEEKK